MAGNSRPPLRAYLAAPLFTQSERQWNRRLAAAVEAALPGVRVVLPQDFRVEGRYNDKRTYENIFRKCLEEIAAA